MTIILYTALGGCLGSMGRFYLANLCKNPLGTWMANITGSILLALLAKELVPIKLDEVALSYLFMFGFCGAFTTFSTFGKETIEFILEKKFLQAGLYVFSSFFVAFAAVIFVMSL